MVIPRDAIVEYQEIYKSMYGKELAFDQASKQAEDFLKLMQAIYKPIKKNWAVEQKKKIYGTKSKKK